MPDLAYDWRMIAGLRQVMPESTSLDSLTSLIVEDAGLTNINALSVYVSMRLCSCSLVLVQAYPCCRCKRLRYLSLRNNAITSVDVISGMRQLVQLDIAYNNIAILPNLVGLEFLERCVC